ncbi:hypothetical protein GOP47_0003589 [Adiantum capillus-veneris]|uniref:Uncharacterized protein n=1 Tax=Adiantum capillus-veneris TaxID=13818 RepID=A0A9D4V6X2_ADICA|nr:hypothetical protein GOP47_0003589 [Adiantum capillus-veneris]
MVFTKVLRFAFGNATWRSQVRRPDFQFAVLRFSVCSSGRCEVEYNKEVASATQTIEITMPEEQREDALRKEKSKIQKRISDRIGKVRCSIFIFSHQMGYYQTLYFEDSKALFKAMILGYTCFAFDNDASIIEDLVEPINLSSEKRPIASKEKEHTRGVEDFSLL